MDLSSASVGSSRVTPDDGVVADDAAWWVVEGAHDWVLGVVGHLHCRDHPLNFVGVDN